MSVVYKGLDTALDREVAVKVLHPHLASKEESRRRLAREAKAVARLHHPNILEVFDYSSETGTDAYLVTEYIRGQTLRQFLASDGFEPPEVAAMVVHEIAQALAHAHDNGVIHRDLKPENVMVREDGVLKLMDFGIAKILDRDEKMTMTGALVGSPAHMAPEIIEGLEAGPEADVFSLGTMLYLFATGRLPFTAANTTATLKRILDGVYDDPRQLVPTVSDELAEVIAMCLARDPANRYPTAGKLRDALHDLLGELGIERIHEELPRYFASPGTYRKELTPRLTAALLGRAEKHLADRRHPKALSALNQVLAHDPSNARAKTLLASMQAARARAQRNRRLVRASFTLGTLLVLCTAGWKGWEVAARPVPYRAPILVSPAQATLPAALFPQPPEPKTAEPPPEPVVVAPVFGEVLKPSNGQTAKPTKLGKVPTVVEPEALTKVAVALAPVKVLVRPFGYLTVDGTRRGGDALSAHTLQLAPGRHTFTVSCDLCEEGGRTQAFEVSAERENTFTLAVPLRPSLVSFQGFPPQAVARIGAEQRTVEESSARPFRIETPKEGSLEMRHQVAYEVTLDGERLQRGVVAVNAGEPLVIRRQGAP